MYVATKHLPPLEGDALHLEGVEGSGRGSKKYTGVWGPSVGEVAWPEPIS